MAPPKRPKVMLRNLPNNYTRAMLLNLLEKEGFVGRFDFLRLGTTTDETDDAEDLLRPLP